MAISAAVGFVIIGEEVKNIRNFAIATSINSRSIYTLGFVMLTKKIVFATSLFLVLCGFIQKSYADDNVCLINNSSHDVTFEASDQDTFKIAAKGGDQNKCWHFHTGVQTGQGGAFGIDAKGGYGIKITANTPSGPAIMITAFIDPLVGAGHFLDWPSNQKWCRKGLCIWHTDKTDVWRLYAEDQQ